MKGSCLSSGTDSKTMLYNKTFKVWQPQKAARWNRPNTTERCAICPEWSVGVRLVMMIGNNQVGLSLINAAVVHALAGGGGGHAYYLTRCAVEQGDALLVYTTANSKMVSQGGLSPGEVQVHRWGPQFVMYVP